MTEKIENDVLIIGSGPAGYTAAIYAARANLKPHLVSGLEPGGQLTITTDVENYPGFENVIQGPWLMEQMKKQAQTYGTRVLNDYVTKVEFNSNIHEVETEKEKFEAHTVIIATGAKAKFAPNCSASVTLDSGLPGLDETFRERKRETMMCQYCTNTKVAARAGETALCKFF